MGVVWRATDTLLARQVALKEVDPRGVDAAEREGLRARVSREARAAARLSHPAWSPSRHRPRRRAGLHRHGAGLGADPGGAGPQRGRFERAARPGLGLLTRWRRPIGPGSSTATSSRRT